MKKTAQKLLTKKEIAAALKRLSGWSVTRNDTVLTKKFSFKTHVEALVAIARITVYAEVHQHHPDIAFTYRTVKVALTTHEAKGLTAADVRLAQQIEERLVDKQQA